MRDKLITAGVVFGGIAALAIAKKLGAGEDVLELGFGALTIVAGFLRSMVLSEKGA